MDDRAGASCDSAAGHFVGLALDGRASAAVAADLILLRAALPREGAAREMGRPAEQIGTMRRRQRPNLL